MRKLLKYPKAVVITCLMITVVLGIQLKNLKLDNSVRQFMPKKDPSYLRMLDTENQFGSMITTGVALETNGKTILTPEYLDLIDRLTKRFESIESVESVESLTNIEYIQGVDGSLVAGTLLGDDYTGSKNDIASIKEKLASWGELYDRVIISDDQRATQIQITFKKGGSEEQKQEMLNSIHKILEEETTGRNLVVKVYGDPVISEQARIFMLKDLRYLIPLVVIVVLLTLLFSFGTVDGTVLPLLTVLMSTVWAVGLMAVFKQTFSIVSSVIPVALIAVGSAYGIHVLTHYYVALDRNQEPLTTESYRQIVLSGLKEVRTAVSLAGVTTIVGFVSLMTSPIGPLHSFAVFTAIGVAFALILSLTFIPAILLLKPLDKVGERSKVYAHLTKNVEMRQLRNQGDGLYAVYRGVAGTKARLLVFLLAVVILSCIGLNRLVIDTSLVNYFPASSEVRKDIDYVDKKFAGTNSVYFTIAGEAESAITNPEILKSMDDLSTYLQDIHPEIGKIVSFPTFVKRMNQVLHIPSTGVIAEETIDSQKDEESSGTALSSFEDEGLSSFSDETVHEGSDYLDPNITYAKKLSEMMTTQDALTLLHDSYVEAGGSSATVEQIVTELEKKLNFNGMAYYEIPYDTAKYPVASREELSSVVSQYLLLFSGSLDQFNDDALSPKVTRMAVQLKTHSTNITKEIIEESKAYAAAHFPQGYTLEATGTGELEVSMTDMVVSSQISSLLFSLLSVMVILSLSFKSLWAGILGSIPLALSILLNYMVMGLTGIHLDLVTSIIASVAIGVGIDYTIHFMETYKAERALSDDLALVTKETFHKSGHGIVVNATAVGFGFLVLCCSQFIVLRYIGILVAIVMFTSSLLAMTVIPGLLNVFDPAFIRLGKNKKN